MLGAVHLLDGRQDIAVRAHGTVLGDHAFFDEPAS